MHVLREFTLSPSVTDTGTGGVRGEGHPGVGSLMLFSCVLSSGLLDFLVPYFSDL